ncbi:MAG: S8 family serine peptidase [Gaiellaceae bacterium]
MSALGAFAVLAALLVAIPAAGALGRGTGGIDRTGGSKTADAAGQYIVRLAEAPVVAYEGGIAGYKATAPSKKGEKINPNHPDVVKYAAYLDSRHDAVLAQVGGSKLYDYRYSLNGFAAKLSAAQAAALKATAGVLSVEKDAIGHVNTATTPAFLGLTQPGGLWEQLGGKGSAGEDVIIGVVDTGIWPEHPSFSDRTRSNANDVDGKLAYQQIPGWHGKCTPGEDFQADECGQKLIGAQYFNAGFGVDGIAERDFLSPRDYNGHGSHTASTAGGNADVPATGAAALFGTISGMAPRARIAAYKVCWEDAGDGGCANSDSVAAIDQAVADGVDVINFSISGTRTNYLDAVEVAFLFAARAGVFVAASAGNEGPGSSTVAHISPWLTSVAAGTHNRSGTATATLGNGAVYTGASLTAAVGPAPLVNSTSVGKAGADPAEVALCFLGTLDPAKAAGKIVYCDRGVNARVDKSAAVKEAGGVGMIMANVTPSSLNADLHTVPTVHLADTDRAAVLAYIAGAGASATASLSQSVVNNSAPAPDIAAFSSRGPSIAGGGDILKPDVMAPGVDVLAAVSPAGNNGKEFDLISGTSMSSPHVAGLAALLRQAHRDWSPMAIKSALMTTASATAPITSGARSPFASGAGQVVPTSASNPGLVYDAGFTDWLMFLQGQNCNCLGDPSFPRIDASDLNLASIAVGDLAGAQTVTRTVKSVGGATETYTASINLPGFTTSLDVPSFSIAPGQTKTYKLSITRTTATLNAYTVGSLTWTGDKGHVVTSRLVIRPVALAAPLAISGTGASGSLTYPVTFGYTGSFGTTVRGLVPASTETATVVDDPTSNFNTANPNGNQGIKVHDVVVPAGSTYARFALFDDFTDGADDLDLYVYRVNADATLTLVGASGTGTSTEEVNLTNPAAATYKAYVHGWETDGPDSNYTFFSWVLGSTAAGNLTATPSTTSAVTAATGSVALAWTGLDATKKYLGAVDYSGSAGMPTTIVRIG